MKGILSVLILMLVPVFIEEKTGAMELKSEAFQEGNYIPDKYTCLGENLSPPLQWSGLPPGAQSLALFCEDVDAPAGAFNHWVIFNIPSTLSFLSEGIARQGAVEEGIRQGTCDSGQVGYWGPCPPPGSPHRYYFRLYALDTYVLLAPGCGKEDLVQTMQGHILGTAELVGLFKREQK